ncbi:MAG: hypothetical protein GY739_14445, partial [Mesoflavibacter sp.]|nr:hypothetical protein [Mesoflavibacter sp.]
RFFTKLYAKVESVQWTEDEWAVLDLENTPEILDEFLDNTTHLLKDGDGADDVVFHDVSLVMPPPNAISSPALPAPAAVVLAGTSQTQQLKVKSQVTQKKEKELSGRLFSSLEDDDDEQRSQHSDSGSSSSSRRRRPAFPTNRRNRRRERRRPDSETQVNPAVLQILEQNERRLAEDRRQAAEKEERDKRQAAEKDERNQQFVLKILQQQQNQMQQNTDAHTAQIQQILNNTQAAAPAESSLLSTANTLTHPPPTINKFDGKINAVFRPFLDEFNMCCTDYPNELKLRYLTSSLTGDASKLYVAFSEEIRKDFNLITAELLKFYPDMRTITQLMQKHLELSQLKGETVVQVAARYQQSQRDFPDGLSIETCNAYFFYRTLNDDIRPEILSKDFTFDKILEEAIKKEDKRRLKTTEDPVVSASSTSSKSSTNGHPPQIFGVRACRFCHTFHPDKQCRPGLASQHCSACRSYGHEPAFCPFKDKVQPKVPAAAQTCRLPSADAFKEQPFRQMNYYSQTNGGNSTDDRNFNPGQQMQPQISRQPECLLCQRHGRLPSVGHTEQNCWYRSQQVPQTQQHINMVSVAQPIVTSRITQVNKLSFSQTVVVSYRPRLTMTKPEVISFTSDTKEPQTTQLDQNQSSRVSTRFPSQSQSEGDKLRVSRDPSHRESMMARTQYAETLNDSKTTTNEQKPSLNSPQKLRVSEVPTNNATACESVAKLLPANGFLFDHLPRVAPDLKRRYTKGRMKSMVAIIDSGSTKTLISARALMAMATQTDVTYSRANVQLVGV